MKVAGESPCRRRTGDSSLFATPRFFAQVLLDRVAGTVVWRNGADTTPKILYDLPRESERRVARKGSRLIPGYAHHAG